MQDFQAPGPEQDSTSAPWQRRLFRWSVGARWWIAALVFLATAVLVSSSAMASRMALDLCSFGNLVLIGTVDGTQGFCSESSVGTQVLTALEFSVDRVIVGPPLTSLELVVPRGSAECGSTVSSGGLPARKGDRFLLVLRQRQQYERPIRLLEWKIDPVVQLPDERDLTSRWRSLCTACSEGYPSGFTTMLESSESGQAQRDGREFVEPRPPLLEDGARCREHSEHLRKLQILP